MVPKLKHCRKTIYTWIKVYRDGGLELLLSSNKGGNNTPLIEQGTKEALAEKLSDPLAQITSIQNCLTGYRSITNPILTMPHSISTVVYTTIVF